MTSRSLRFRVIALILAGALPATMGIGAFGAHPCPHHDGATAISGPPAPDGAAGHTHHGDVTARSGVDTDDAPTHDEHGPCNCVGDCTMSSGPAQVSPVAVQSAPLQASRTATSRATEAAPRSRPDFLIPFATAPPAPFAA